MKKTIFTISILIFNILLLAAQNLRLSEIFNDGVVLQRNANVEIWGKAKPSKKVELSIQKKTYKTKADRAGYWNLTITNLKEGGPYSLEVTSSKETKKLNEVYVGEVWIAAGQSNMEWPLRKVQHAEQVLSMANNKNIRFMMVPRVTYEGQQVSGDMLWRTATIDNNVGEMSGIGYFFAKELQDSLKVPIGIICCYRGGTSAEVWMSREKVLSNSQHEPIVENYNLYMKRIGGEEGYKKRYADYQQRNKLYNDSVSKGFTPRLKKPGEPMGTLNFRRPNGLYYTMLKRIIPYTAKGIIWYQGEGNASRAEQYQTLFPALIEEWRSDFKNPELPFYFVQLSNYDHPDYNYPAWAELREAQLITWQSTPNTTMTVSMDAGEKNDIHPIYKEPIGKRMAASALNNLYGFEIPYSGPIFKNIAFEGNRAVLSFDFVYEGFDDSAELKGFTICGEDKNFLPAKAKIEGDKIFVFTENISKPIAVRYNWVNWGDGNLKNRVGLPASPFRTDNYPLKTLGVRSPNY